MPAASEPVTTATDLPRTYRPLGARVAAGVAAVVLIAAVGFLWSMLSADVQATFTPFQRITLAGVFAVFIALLNALFRTKAVADVDGLTVVNGYATHRLEWAEIVRISLTPNRPWALLDLADGDTVSVMALQTADGERASRSTRELAAVIARQSGGNRDDQH
jgi:hypothetical protein